MVKFPCVHIIRPLNKTNDPYSIFYTRSSTTSHDSHAYMIHKKNNMPWQKQQGIKPQILATAFCVQYPHSYGH